MKAVKPLITITALFLLLAPVGLYAVDDDAERARVKQRIKLIKMWKLTEILNLDEERAAKIFPVIQRFDAQMEEIHRQHGENIKALKAALDVDPPRDEDLTKILDGMMEERNKLVRIQTEEIDALRGMLSPLELGKLILFQDEFRKEIHKIIKESRRGRRGFARRGFGDDQPPPPPDDF